MNLITLITDFGTRDWFVGAMKGVILGLNPRATVVDLTHEVPAGDVWAGAFALAAVCRCFPRGTVHVAVVDPGVGGSRPALAVRTHDYCFVGPDNGVLSLALAQERIRAAHRLENERFFRQPVSHTFHGRDVFAPVAAHLSKGGGMTRLGPAVKDFIRLPWPAPVRSGTVLRGEVIYIDRFGNAITNLDNGSVTPLAGTTVRIGRRRAIPVAPFYQAVPAGRPVAVPGSTGFLEIAVNGGHAASTLRLKRGTVVRVDTARPSRDRPR